MLELNLTEGRSVQGGVIYISPQLVCAILRAQGEAWVAGAGEGEFRGYVLPEWC